MQGTTRVHKKRREASSHIPQPSSTTVAPAKSFRKCLLMKSHRSRAACHTTVPALDSERQDSERRNSEKKRGEVRFRKARFGKARLCKARFGKCSGRQDTSRIGDLVY